MNAGSLSLQKITTKKASILIKVFFVLPLFLFVDYILMAILTKKAWRVLIKAGRFPTHPK